MAEKKEKVVEEKAVEEKAVEEKAVEEKAVEEKKEVKKVEKLPQSVAPEISSQKKSGVLRKLEAAKTTAEIIEAVKNLDPGERNALASNVAFQMNRVLGL